MLPNVSASKEKNTMQKSSVSVTAYDAYFPPPIVLIVGSMPSSASLPANALAVTGCTKPMRVMAAIAIPGVFVNMSMMSPIAAHQMSIAALL